MGLKWRYSKAKAVVVILVANLLKLVNTGFPKSRKLDLHAMAVNDSVSLAITSSRNLEAVASAPALN
jgi:hypothetical protein